MRKYDVRGVAHELRYRWRRGRPASVSTSPLPEHPVVSVVCASNRPAQFDHVVRAYKTQRWANKELVIVVNVDEFDAPVVSDDITVLHRSSNVSLGECLNEGFAATQGDVIARIDDDDFYAPTYLGSVVAAMRSSGADLVGKVECFAFVESEGVMIRRFPGSAGRFVGRLTGGTISVRRATTKSLRFPESNIGEDVAYVRAAERQGLRVWADSAYGYLAVRRGPEGGHTWTIDDLDYISSGEVVATGARPDLWQEEPDASYGT